MTGAVIHAAPSLDERIAHTEGLVDRLKFKRLRKRTQLAAIAENLHRYERELRQLRQQRELERQVAIPEGETHG